MLDSTPKLRIAQVAPLYESVPPRLYGGTERIVSYLTEELVALGHDVTLFASGDSVSSARIIPQCEQALWITNSGDPISQHSKMLEQVYHRRSDFDAVHFHLDFQLLGSPPPAQLVHATTVHGRLDVPCLSALQGKFRAMPLVSISMQQRDPFPDGTWVANIGHGLPLALHHPGPGGDYLAFVGRLSRDKRVDRAVEISERAGLRLKVAAKIDPTEEQFYRDVVAPLWAKPHVEYLGELDEVAKGELLRHARALVFPIDWPEPFGLVMIEAMACGTPVIAYRCGSVPEVVDEGVTGFVIDSIDDAVLAVERSKSLSRAKVRERFEARFSATRMANEYLALYARLGG